MDAVAPGLLLAQGIGRIGNWWNQELYGKPTHLPVGAQDRRRSTSRASRRSTWARAAYHPTFLYELLWDLAGVALLLWLDRRYRSARPALFALYVAYYCFGRFFEELLRIDPSHHFAGLRLNAWVSLILFVGSTVFFIWWQVLGRGGKGATGPPQGRNRGHSPTRRGRGWPSRKAASGSRASLPRMSGQPSPSASSTSTSTRSRGRSTCC